MIPQTTELSQIQAAFIDKDNRIEELMRQINSAQSLLNSLRETMNSLVGDGKITIQTYAGSNVGDFTVNQKEDKTITLPQQATVNNGTLTIQENGTSVGTFTANQSGNTTANISVPTKTSEITNDSDFVSDANYVHTDNNFTNADKAEIGKINNSLQFTYVVDSDQKLADWANNVAGNDYTSVLIKKGEYTFSGTTGINLTTTNTKTITGETGSILYFSLSTNQEAAIYYDNIPETNDYYIKNVTVKTIRHDNHCLKKCINIYNCILSAEDSSVATQYCNNIVDSMISGTYAASHCIGIVNSVAYKGSGNISYQRGFNDCYSMFNCKVKDSISTPYSSSYSSPTANSTYACANTLNGGWNQ